MQVKVTHFGHAQRVSACAPLSGRPNTSVHPPGSKTVPLRPGHSDAPRHTFIPSLLAPAHVHVPSHKMTWLLAVTMQHSWGDHTQFTKRIEPSSTQKATTCVGLSLSPAARGGRHQTTMRVRNRSNLMPQLRTDPNRCSSVRSPCRARGVVPVQCSAVQKRAKYIRGIDTKKSPPASPFLAQRGGGASNDGF